MGTFCRHDATSGFPCRHTWKGMLPIQEPSSVPTAEGNSDGASLGNSDGNELRNSDVKALGNSDGNALGNSEGMSTTGIPVGDLSGNVDGALEGAGVGRVGGGRIDGTLEGNLEGAADESWDGNMEGNTEGNMEGNSEVENVGNAVGVTGSANDWASCAITTSSGHAGQVVPQILTEVPPVSFFQIASQRLGTVPCMTDLKPCPLQPCVAMAVMSAKSCMVQCP